MKKIAKENYFELSVSLMDYHSGQWSRSYRLLCRLRVSNVSEAMCAEMRESECYQYVVANYGRSV